MKQKTNSNRAVTAKRTVRRAHASHHFGLAFKHAQLAIIIARPDGSILDANRQACRLFGYTLKELRQIGRAGIFSQDKTLKEKVRERKKTGRAEGELTGIRKNGSHFPVSFSSVIFKDEEGQDCTCTIMSDLTEKKRAEQEMKWLVNNTTESFILLDTSLNILSYNNQFETLYRRYFNIRVKKGDSILSYAQSGRLNELKALYKRVLQGSHERSTLHLPIPGQGIKHFEINYYPGRDEKGGIIGVFITALDITEQKKAEEQLKNTLHALNERIKEQNCLFKIAQLSNEDHSILQLLEKAITFIPAGWQFPEITTASIRLGKIRYSLPGFRQNKWKLKAERTTDDGEKLTVTVVYLEKRPVAQDGPFLKEECQLIESIADSLQLNINRILARQKSEFEKQDKEALINNTHDLMWSVSSDFKLIAANKAFTESLKKSTGRLLKPGDNLLLWDRFPAEFLRFWEQRYKRALAGESFMEEVYTPAIGGQPESWDEINFNPIYHHKEIVGVACFGRNISNFKIYERQLVSTNQKLETAQQIAQLGYWEFDLVTKNLFWSDEVYRIWGLRPGEIALHYDYFYQSIHPDDRAGFDAAQLPALEGKTTLDVEHRILLPDGSVKYVHEKGELVRNSAGEPIRFEGTVQDITERKKVLQLVTESEDRYKQLFTRSPLPKWIYDLEEFRILEVNEAAVAHYGYSREQFLGMTIFQIRPVEDLEKLQNLNRTVSREGTIRFGQWRHLKADGSLIEVEVAGHRTHYEGKEAMLVACVDVTQREKAQRELAASIERFEYVQKATFDGIWDWNLLTNDLYLGEGYLALFGYKPEQHQPDLSFWSSKIHPEDAERVTSRLQASVDDPDVQNWSDEYRYRRENGTYAFVLDKGIIIRNAEGKAQRMIGAISDVSLLKETENKLASERNLLRILVDTLPDYIYVKDRETRHILNNRKMLELLGVDNEEETLHKTLSDFFDPAIAEIYLADDRELIRTGIPIIDKTEPLHLPADTRWLSTTKIPLRENGSITGLVGISRDITDFVRNQQEKELALSINRIFSGEEELDKCLEKMLEECCLLFGQQAAEAWVTNIDQTLIRLTAVYGQEGGLKGYQKNMSFSPGEGLVGSTWEQQSHFYVRDLQTNNLYRRKEFASLNQLVSATAIPVFYQNMVTAVLVFYNSRSAAGGPRSLKAGNTLLFQLGSDIHRKKTELELKSFFNYAPELMCIAGKDGYFKKVNPAFCDLLGYTEEELTSRPFTDFVHPDDLRNTSTRLKEATSGRLVHSFENRYRTREGDWKWISWSSSDLISEEGLVFGYGKDVTETRKLKDLLDQSNELARIGSWEVDLLRNTLYWSDVTRKLHEVESDYVPTLEEGIRFYKEGSSREQITQAVQEAISKGRSWDLEVEFITAKGNTRWVRAIGQAEFSEGNCVRIYGSFQDIHERKLLELERSQILESISDAFYALDSNWNFTYFNKEAENLLGRRAEELIGKNIWRMFPGALDTLIMSKFEEVAAENRASNFEYYFPGTGNWYEINAYPFNGGVSAFFKNIDERRKAEEAIRLSNERYNLVARATNDSIWDWNLLEDITLRTGNGFKNLFGYDIEEAKKDQLFWTKRLHPDDRERVQVSQQKAFDDPEEYYWEDEYRFRKANGQYAYVYDKGYIIRDEKGRAIRMIGATQDVTQQKEQVNEIIRIQQNLHSLINTTTDLIWSVDLDFRIITANKAYNDFVSHFTGKPVIEGDPVLVDGFGEQYTTRWTTLYQRVLNGESFNIEESTMDPETGEPAHMIVSFSPILNKNGMAMGAACYAKDVTELKKSATRLEELNNSLLKRTEELSNSNAELERFAYVASHDLQEPLRMVSSFLQLLEKKYKPQLDEAGSQYIQYAVNGAERMKMLIQDLLNYSRMNNVQDQVEPTDLNEVLNEVLNILQTQIRESGARVELARLPVLPGARRGQMLQLFQNLVGNALKYRGEQVPEIRVDVSDEKEHWLFSVKDNGIGIDPKYFQKIFIIFQRLHHKNEYSGTGIGLSICKKIVERHGGRIWVESSPGQGSVFYFTLPKSIYKGLTE